MGGGLENSNCSRNENGGMFLTGWAVFVFHYGVVCFISRFSSSLNLLSVFSQVH